MCDKYGFMVIDEADIEAHGPFMIYRREDTDYNRFKRWNEKIADDPVWEEANNSLWYVPANDTLKSLSALRITFSVSCMSFIGL